MKSSIMGRPPEVVEYIEKVGNRVPKYQYDLFDETEKQCGRRSIMSVEHGQSEFMRFLVQSTRAKRGIQIGTFTGASSCSLASGFDKDDKTCQLWCLDVSQEWTSIAKQYWKEAGVEDQIELIIGDGVQTLEQFIKELKMEETIDFCFIDADQINYPVYYELCLKLLQKGGWIAVDNVLWGNEIVNTQDLSEDTKVLQKFNLFIQNDQRVDICMLSIADGLSLIYQK